MIDFNIILLSESKSSFRLSCKNSARISLLSLACYMPCTSHSPRLITLIIFGEECNLWSSSLCSFLQPRVISSLFGPNILLSTLFSNTLSLCSSLNVRDQVSHPYKTTSKIIVYNNDDDDDDDNNNNKLMSLTRRRDAQWIQSNMWALRPPPPNSGPPVAHLTPPSLHTVAGANTPHGVWCGRSHARQGWGTRETRPVRLDQKTDFISELYRYSVQNISYSHCHLPPCFVRVVNCLSHKNRGVRCLRTQEVACSCG
jgi:hypothetical protein